MMHFLVLTYDERKEILYSELRISVDKNAVEICQIKYDILTVFGFSERKWIDEVSVLLLIQRAVIIQHTVVRALDIYREDFLIIIVGNLRPLSEPVTQVFDYPVRPAASILNLYTMKEQLSRLDTNSVLSLFS